MTIKIIIDATNATLGRLCSYAAKQSLLGKEVVIVNCSQAVITGRRRFVIDNYKEKRERGGSSLKGPNFPSSPERIVKRTVRGMLSFRQGRGSLALKRIICYNSVPEEYKASKMIHAGKEKNTTVTSLKELSREFS